MDLNKAFENRWRIYGLPHADDATKQLVRRFFEAGILIGQGERDEETVSSASFEDFWNAYDKKIARPKCEKLWNALTTKEKKLCMDYIPPYKQAQPDKQFRKNPETFLRNKSWNDEIIFRNDNTNNVQQQRYDKLANILAG